MDSRVFKSCAMVNCFLLGEDLRNSRSGNSHVLPTGSLVPVSRASTGVGGILWMGVWWREEMRKIKSSREKGCKLKRLKIAGYTNGGKEG